MVTAASLRPLNALPLMLAAAILLGQSSRAFAVEATRCILTARIEPAQQRMTVEAHVRVREKGNDSRQVSLILNKRAQIKGVTAGGAPASFVFERGSREIGELKIDLDPPLKRGSECEITLEYELAGDASGQSDPDWMGILLIRPGEVRMTGQTRWAPALPSGETPFEATVELPGDLTLVGSGKVDRIQEQDGKSRWRLTSEKPVAPALIARPYVVSRNPAGNNELTAYLSKASATNGPALAQEAAAILGFLEQRFGPCPFGELGICEMNVLNPRHSYNYAAASYVVLPAEIVQMAGRGDRQELLRQKLAHEVAHQWWGNCVRFQDPDWRLGESLAEWSALMYVRSREDRPRPLMAAWERAAALADYAQQEGQPLDGGDYRKHLAYEKGPCVLVMLRNEVGPETFDTALRTLYRQHAFAQVDAAAFWQAMEAAKGQSLTWFAEQWLSRRVLPRVQVSVLRTQGNELVLQVTQAKPAFRLPVDIRLLTDKGTTITRCLLSQEVQEHRVTIQGKLRSIEVDPNRALLLVRPAADMQAAMEEAATHYEALVAALKQQNWPASQSASRQLRDTLRGVRRAKSVALEQQRPPGRAPALRPRSLEAISPGGGGEISGEPGSG